MIIRTYSELIRLDSFEERYKYLKLNNGVGEETFGFDRVFNQKFYKSKGWKRIRDLVILRDNGCDLGDPNRPIFGKILIHHMNPITLTDIKNTSDFLMDPEYLITTTHKTHNAIHYGCEDISDALVERSLNDTCPWRQSGRREDYDNRGRFEN